MRGITISLAVVAVLFTGVRADGITPVEKIDLLGEEVFPKLELRLDAENSPATKREEIFAVKDGVLRVTGKGTGYLRTKEVYGDFHLVLEYQWRERNLGEREDRARAGGVLVHGQGEKGSGGDFWPASLEVELLEGGSGNIVKRGAKKGEEDERIAWPGRDPGWVDVRGFRGANDVENPVREWNRLEVICEGESVRVLLNGKVVNEVSGVAPSEGRIGLQSEGSEYAVRRFEVWPLSWFREAWKDLEGPTDMGAGGKDLLPRRFPLSPEESMAAMEVDGEYEVQLVAAEPLVNDPVDIAFDAEGRVYVAEMRDYPMPVEEGTLLSRIRLLKDRDGDGRMDEAVNWASELDHVQGLLPMDGGLLVTTRTAILFMRDSDGDDMADEKAALFRSNDPKHSQLQVSSPRWGIDGRIYLNNGLDATEIYPEGAPEKILKLAKDNLRYDPESGEMDAVSGRGQFGATIDEWGRRYASSNRNPVMFAVMPREAVERNPFAALTEGHEDVALFGGEATVYPAVITHTTSSAHHGTHTASCGLGIYKGDLIPEFRQNVFVCEPPGQLVARSAIAPKGASFWAERVRLKPRTEFLRSRDDWFRPVNIRNAPDGALYVCDMYRRFIDHATFFPEEFIATHHMRAGFDEGRIYRVVPRGGTANRAGEKIVFPEEAEGLVAMLGHPNGWHRETAHRLLLERADASIVPLLEGMLNDNSVAAEARARILWTIERLGKLEMFHVLAAMADPEPGVAENALELAGRFSGEAAMQGALLAATAHESRRVRMLAVIALGEIEGEGITEAFAKVLTDDPEDRWLQRAVLSGAETRAAEILSLVLGDPSTNSGQVPPIEGANGEGFTARGTPGRMALVSDFSAAVAARGDVKELKAVFGLVDGGDWWGLAIVNGLGEGLKRHQGKLGHKSLATLLAKPPEELREAVAGAQGLVDEASLRMVDGGAEMGVRLAAIPLLAFLPAEKGLATFGELIGRRQPEEIQKAAFAAMKRFNRDQLTDLFFARWNDLGPIAQRDALEMMSASAATAKRLFEKMKAGEINPALMDTMNRWKWGRSTDEELKRLALELWGQPSADRAGVLKDYGMVLEMKGDVARGKAIWVANCSTCHKVDGEGNEVGPDISDVRNKTPDALLSDILDPNRVVETSDGRTLTGVIAAETADTVVLHGLGVNETLARGETKKITSLDISLMPVGLEGAIDREQMADLMAFLRER